MSTPPIAPGNTCPSGWSRRVHVQSTVDGVHLSGGARGTAELIMGMCTARSVAGHLTHPPAVPLLPEQAERVLSSGYEQAVKSIAARFCQPFGLQMTIR